MSLGIEAISLTSSGGDFNDDLRRYGTHAIGEMLREQLHPEDTRRFLARERQDCSGR